LFIIYRTESFHSQKCDTGFVRVNISPEREGIFVTWPNGLSLVSINFLLLLIKIGTSTNTLAICALEGKCVSTMKSLKTLDERHSQRMVFILRLLLLIAIYTAYVNSKHMQQVINSVWEFLRHQWWYQSVYNETILVQVWSYPAIFIYRLIHHFKWSRQYRYE